MQAFETKVRRVGSSFGVLIPKGMMSENKIREDEIVRIAIIRKNPYLIEKSFGLFKTKKKFKRDRNDRDF